MCLFFFFLHSRSARVSVTDISFPRPSSKSISHLVEEVVGKVCFIDDILFLFFLSVDLGNFCL